MSGVPRMSRRALLRGGGLAGLAVFLPMPGARAESALAVALDGPGFLTDAERATLSALVDRLVPGQPEDPSPGAVAAGCVEAIDALLAAFAVDPPRIYAGAPFSDRAGSPVNHFTEFLPLDPYEERSWRLRIEGSQGREDLEFNGPVPGWQAVYREGLAALDAAAGGAFAELPGPARDVVLRTTQDEAVLALVDVAFVHTLESFYGAPEYGGNRDLVAWEFTNFDGDVQPRGWTREQVEQPDEPSPVPEPPLDVSAWTAIAPLGTYEAVHGLLARTGGALRGLQAEVAALQASRGLPGAAPAQVAAAVDAVARRVAEGHDA